MLPTKIEIKLKKAEALSWGQLEYPKAILPKSTSELTNSETNEKQKSSESGVELMDLTDL